MLQYILRRCLISIPTLIIISIVSFILIQLPPGDFVDAYISERLIVDGSINDVDALRASIQAELGISDSMIVNYFNWISGFPKGDFGYSFQHQKPVSDLIWGKLGLTFLITFVTLVFTLITAFITGIISAMKPYTLFDYIVSFFGFLGLAVPNFLLALLLMYLSLDWFGTPFSGLFSPEYLNAPWSMDKLWDALSHIWIPVIVVGTAGTASQIRIMRATMMDELHKPYVDTARSKGLPTYKVILKYPVRHAVTPLASTIGWQLPELVSGSAIVAIVLSLPTTGPYLLQALQGQDMYLAGTFLMMLAVLTIIGTLLSDIILALLDPRIRLS
ncbi:ABC transporter permease [Psychromonas algicola]|uniref:ABC transporter permease n=1 Tax=Psychromonas algicola TaxID=2555642 RepID=UPI0010680F3C|nr:ABC transporter permease [Psychromonas sp. RZ5]TEW51243.1 ABC transporter permease [Psychromonas sp. RZ5]